MRTLWLLPILLLAGCAGVKVQDYQGTSPRLAIEDYFAGSVRAWGIFQDRSGMLKRQFTVDIEGAWEGEEFVLREDFAYRDGERQQRTWRIRKLDEHRYEGVADDVVGRAQGVAYGSALNWSYTLAIEVDGREWHIDFDDWMYLQEDGVLLNKAEMTKFGFRVGEVTLMFQKEDTQ